VGSGEEEKNIREAVERTGLSDRIEMVPRLARAELVERYARAACTVYIPDNEPFGLVSVESQAAGTPVVVSNSCGPAETIREGVTGLSVDPRDTEAVRDAILTVLEKEFDPRVLRDHAREKFGMDRFGEVIESAIVEGNKNNE